MALDVTKTETANEDAASGSEKSKLGTGAWIGIAVAALVVGALVGHFLLGGAAGGALHKSKLSEGELETAVGSYTYNNATTSVTAKEVMEQSGLLESSKDEEGNYSVPSADTIVSYARNKIISAEADAKGVSISDDDLSKYAEEMLGSSDFETVASTYNMEVDTVKEVLRNSAKMNKLRDQVIGGETAGEAPEAPTAPEVAEDADDAAKEAANNEEKKEYADYIIKLAGDQWDAEKGEFKDKSSSYATALADYKVTKDGASYNAANAAYYVAYQDYSTKQNEITEKWTDYVNELLGNASITVFTLKS